MPAVADLPPKPDANIVAPQADAQGDEGRYLSNASAEAAFHWESRAERLVVPAQEDEFDYDSVPLDVVASVRIQYRFVGDIEPMPYESDE